MNIFCFSSIIQMAHLAGSLQVVKKENHIPSNKFPTESTLTEVEGWGKSSQEV